MAIAAGTAIHEDGRLVWTAAMEQYLVREG